MKSPAHKLIIVGAGEFAEIAWEYFTHDSPYTVEAFAVERQYLRTEQFKGLPVVPFEELPRHYTTQTHSVFVAVTYTGLNRVRARLFAGVKAMGFKCATYVSSHAFVWHSVKLGENVFIFENNVIQHGVEIGDDVILWSGNHIGHRSVIEPHCYVASHVVISGYCHIGTFSFLGVNATLADHVTLGSDSVVGAGALMLQSAAGNTVYQGSASQAAKASSRRLFKVPPEK